MPEFTALCCTSWYGRFKTLQLQHKTLCHMCWGTGWMPSKYFRKTSWKENEHFAWNLAVQGDHLLWLTGMVLEHWCRTNVCLFSGQSLCNWGMQHSPSRSSPSPCPPWRLKLWQNLLSMAIQAKQLGKSFPRLYNCQKRTSLKSSLAWMWSDTWTMHRISWVEDGPVWIRFYFPALLSEDALLQRCVW